MVTFSNMNCGECGIEFTVPDHFFNERKKTGKGWFCPNGHSRVFKESEVEVMRRERDRAVQEKARLEEELKSKDQEMSRLKNRAVAGVCQCCNRTFTNMSRHMKTKHPEMLADNVVKIKKKA